MKGCIMICFLFLLAGMAIGQTGITKGVYGNPGSLLKAGYRFDSLGMNAVFVRSISLNPQFFATAKEQGCKVYVEFPTLYGKDYLQNHPDAWPIDSDGKRAQPADWFMGICATDPAFKAFRLKQLKEILDNYDVDGIFLDYFHWHAQFETDKPILPETCFCDRCTSLFGEHLAKKISGDNAAAKASWILNNEEAGWREWRTGILNTWIDDMKVVLRARRPGALLGIYHCGWYPSDHDSALGRILGINMQNMAERADVLAPMLFHGMLGRDPKWVGEYLSWLKKEMSQFNKRPLVWPIVQAHNKPGTVSSEEFRTVMTEGLTSPSTGIMMFEDGSLLSDPEKMKVMKELYRGRR